MRRKHLLLALGFAGTLLSLPYFLEGAGRKSSGPQYSKTGSLLFPADYRGWVFLSSSLGVNYDPARAIGAAPPFQNIFVNPEAHAEYLKSGVWPDKTVMLLEIRASETHDSFSKGGRVQNKLLAMEAHVKDKARGGWAFYELPAGATEGKLFPKTQDCYSCHEQNASTDTTFVQFYPTLVETSKRHGTYKEKAH